MDKILNILIESFDFSYMFTVNILTYIIIKIVDECNGEKIVPTWAKRVIATVCGIVIGIIVITTTKYSNAILYSFILSLVSWDVLFKPILKKFTNLNYRK